jgi:hypothetical protein
VALFPIAAKELRRKGYFEIWGLTLIADGWQVSFPYRRSR